MKMKGQNMSDAKKVEQRALEAQYMALNNPTVADWRDDSEALALFIRMILSNGRLSSAIVNAWLKQYHKVLVDEPAAPK
jgi:hypothetical protein